MQCYALQYELSLENMNFCLQNDIKLTYMSCKRVGNFKSRKENTFSN